MSIIEKAVDRLDARQPTDPRRAETNPAPARSSAPADEPRQTRHPEEAPPAWAAAAPERLLDDALARLADEPIRDAPATGEPRRSREVALDVKRLKAAGILTPGDQGSQIAEECRLIKRPILHRAFGDPAAPGDRRNLVMVTSSVPGEGKTFLSVSLAISMATELDRTVLLVDADLANPGLSRLLKADERPGLTERLLDDAVDLKNLLLRTDVPKLTLLPAGRRHRRSTELLASNAMKGLLDELATRYPDRVVLFDSPPLLATSEASVLAEQAGQVCLVVESTTTPQFLVKEALGLLAHQDRVSLVLNKTRDELLSGRRGYYYGYRYGYGYERGYGYGKDDAAA